MRKKITALFMALLVLFPKTSHADIDVLSVIQDEIKVFQEKVTTITTKYIGIQVNLQEVALNRDIVSNLRDNVKDQLKEKANKMIGEAKDGALEFVNNQLSTVTLPGLNSAITFGPYTSPLLKQKTAKAFTKRTDQSNDVMVNKLQDIRNNKEIAENVSIIYANALVTRKKLMDEAKEDTSKEEEKNPDINTVQFRYGQVARRASHRWLEILKFESAYYKALAEIQMTEGRVGDISSLIGDDEENVDTEGLEDIATDVANSRGSIDILALKDQWDTGKKAIESGNYKDALGELSSLGGVMSSEK